MRLINVTNSFRNLVNQQLSGADARLVKVFSLGQTTVVYTRPLRILSYYSPMNAATSSVKKLPSR